MRFIALFALTFLGCGSANTTARNHGRPPTGPTPVGSPVPMPTLSADAATSAAPSASVIAEVKPPHVFPPPPLPPPEPVSKREGDGEWKPLNAGGMNPSPIAWTIVHPHPTSPLIEMAIVAIDLDHASMHIVPGTEEPTSTTVAVASRSGLVPTAETPDLLALSNGGFKARHGKHGMKIGDQVYLPPVDNSCTLAMTKEGEVRIGTWNRLAANESDFAWYRQGAPCLVEDGVIGRDVTGILDARTWGAAPDGGRSIRRSAYAMTKDKSILYFAIGNQVDPDFFGHVLSGLGMDVACQFDVNYSFVRFVVFDRDSAGGLLPSQTIMKDLRWTKGEGITKSDARDFFYFTKKL